MSNLLPPALKSAILVAVAALSFGNACETQAALIAAIDRGDSAALQRALESKPDLEPACDPYAICKPLALAASHGDLAMVKVLLAAGADPNGRNAYGDTAFMVAGDWLAAKGRAPTNLRAIRAYLLNHGVDPDQANDDGATVFIGSAGAGGMETLELCLQHGGSINRQSRKIGYTPLMAAAQFGQWIPSAGFWRTEPIARFGTPRGGPRLRLRRRRVTTRSRRLWLNPDLLVRDNGN